MSIFAVLSPNGSHKSHSTAAAAFVLLEMAWCFATAFLARRLGKASIAFIGII
jgi:hypothetical protein